MQRRAIFLRPLTDAPGYGGILHPSSRRSSFRVLEGTKAGRARHNLQRLNAIVKGRRGVSADTALLFESLTRQNAQIWMTLQAK